MLKVVMARPVADAPQESGYARSINYHIVQGTIDPVLKDFLSKEAKDRDGLWFHFIKRDGLPLLVNAAHVAWIEEIDESRQVARPS